MTVRDATGSSEVVGELAELAARGFVVLPEVISPREVDTIRAQLAPHLRGAWFGRNDFEGFRTERVYALLAKAPAVATLVEHPRVLAIVDALLLPNYLLSANLVINVHPGETAQQFHFDDAFFPLQRPRSAVGCTAIWALDEFRPDNGATEVIPGSHRWGDETPLTYGREIEAVTMSPGSVLLMLGTLWHRGGAHRSNAPRLAVTPQYCEPWMRPIETMTLAIPPRLAAQYSPRTQAMLGYSIHPPFMGYVDGTHPGSLLVDQPEHNCMLGPVTE